MLDISATLFLLLVLLSVTHELLIFKFLHMSLLSKLKKWSGGSIDTRTLEPGNIFFAIKGEHVDGHDFITEALAKGASVVVVSREWFEQSDNLSDQNDRYVVVDDVVEALQQIAIEHRAQFNVPVICISGCNGKTTTKNLLAAVLKKHFGDDAVLYTKGNNNNHIGVPLTLLSLSAGHKVAVIELGSNHPGEIDALCKIAKPTHGITTNIGAAHIEFFGTLEAIADEEGALASYIPDGGVYILPKEDQYSEYIATKVRSKSPAEGSTKRPGVTIEFIRADNEETLKKLSNIGIVAPHIVLDACMVITLAKKLGISDETIFSGLQSASNDTGRFSPKEVELFGVKNTEGEPVRFTAIDDTYNGNPDSVIAAMNATSKLYSNSTESKILALGALRELGGYAHTGYIRILHAAKELNFSEVVFVGIEEDFSDISGEFVGEIGELKLTKVSDNTECVDYLKSILIKNAQAGRQKSVVLCKGSHSAKMWEVVEGLTK